MLLNGRILYFAFQIVFIGSIFVRTQTSERPQPELQSHKGFENPPSSFPTPSLPPSPFCLPWMGFYFTFTLWKSVYLPTNVTSRSLHSQRRCGFLHLCVPLAPKPDASLFTVAINSYSKQAGSEHRSNPTLCGERCLPRASILKFSLPGSPVN